MLSFDALVAIAPNQICIPITPDDEQAVNAEIDRARYSNENARQQAYYNALSLRLLQPWIAEMLDTEPPPTCIASEQLPSVWDVVNGTAIQVNHSRLVLIPSGDRPFDELSVPQEWVDHPDWCGDYYLAIDIDTEQQWLRVVGYVPYQFLKQTPIDDIDRTYCVEATDLIEDLNVLWIGQELLPNPKPVVASLPSLGSETAQRLIAQLSAVKHYSPRLDIPFAQWSALITNDEYRQMLYERRSGDRAVQSQIRTMWNWIIGAVPTNSPSTQLNVAYAKGVEEPTEFISPVQLAHYTIQFSGSLTQQEDRIEVAITAERSSRNSSDEQPWKVAILDENKKIFTDVPETAERIIHISPFRVQQTEEIYIRVTLAGQAPHDERVRPGDILRRML
jgi:hypothetical protein